jgi:hypothetical protein
VIGSQVEEVPPREAAPGDTRPGPPRPRAGTAWRRTILLHLAVIGGFTALGVVLWWHVWITGHPTSTLPCQCGDPSQELWFLTWTPWALVHGHSPFLSNAIYAGQGGANMMVNTSWMLPAVVLSPVTWLLGPIASFNVAATLAPAVSGWCFFVAARRVTTALPAQVLGGLLFGFSPFVLWNDPFGHINFTLLFFPPLAFILLLDLIVTHRHPPRWIGMWLAVLVVAQFFTSTELLAMGMLVIALALVGAAALAPRRAWRQRGRLLVAFGTAAGIVAVVLAYPVWFVVAGPRRVVGAPWPDSPQFGTTPSALFDAGVRVHQSSYFNITGGYYGGAGPNAGPDHLPSLIYFGVPLVALLVVSAVTWYRSRLAWTLVIGTVVAWVLSFGTTLGYRPGGSDQDHPWWLPWRLFAHVPLVSDVLPIRFGALVTFGAAMLVAISLDRWAALIGTALSRTGPTPAVGRAVVSKTATRARTVAALVVTAVGVAILVPVALTNSVPFTVMSTPMPAWFTLDAPRLPAGTVVLVVPFEGQRAMGWQAQTLLHFDLAGGFAVVPDPDGTSAFVSPPTGAVAWLGRISSDPESLQDTPLPSTPAQVAGVRAAIERWKVGVTVVTQEGRQPLYSVAFLTAVYGRVPTFVHQVWTWTGPPGSGAITLAPSTLAECSSVTSTAPGHPEVPRCVVGGRPDPVQGAVPS